MRLRDLRKLVEQLSAGGGGFSLGTTQIRPNANATLLGGDPTTPPEVPITPLVPTKNTFVVARFVLQADSGGPAEATMNFTLDAPLDPDDPGGSSIAVDEANVLAGASTLLSVALTGFVPAGVDYWLYVPNLTGVNASIALNQLFETPL